MKAWIALGLVAIGIFIAIVVSGPLFDGAAVDICRRYAEDQGWEMVDAYGSMGRNRRLRIPPRRIPDYSCTFQDQFGKTVLLDEFDRVLERTARSRWLRFGGWAVMIALPAGAVIVSGLMGLLPRRD